MNMKLRNFSRTINYFPYEMAGVQLSLRNVDEMSETEYKAPADVSNLLLLTN